MVGFKRIHVFNALPNQEDNDWLFLENAPSLVPYAALVTLAKVGDELYKLNGLQRKSAGLLARWPRLNS